MPKKYYAHVAGVVTEEDVKEFAKGVILDDGYETKPGALTILKAMIFLKSSLSLQRKIPSSKAYV